VRSYIPYTANNNKDDDVTRGTDNKKGTSPTGLTKHQNHQRTGK
jgi:hypothetical protein